MNPYIVNINSDSYRTDYLEQFMKEHSHKLIKDENHISMRTKDITAGMLCDKLMFANDGLTDKIFLWETCNAKECTRLHPNLKKKGKGTHVLVNATVYEVCKKAFEGKRCYDLSCKAFHISAHLIGGIQRTTFEKSPALIPCERDYWQTLPADIIHTIRRFCISGKRRIDLKTYRSLRLTCKRLNNILGDTLLIEGMIRTLASVIEMYSPYRQINLFTIDIDDDIAIITFFNNILQFNTYKLFDNRIALESTKDGTTTLIHLGRYRKVIIKRGDDGFMEIYESMGKNHHTNSFHNFPRNVPYGNYSYKKFIKGCLIFSAILEGIHDDYPGNGGMIENIRVNK